MAHETIQVNVPTNLAKFAHGMVDGQDFGSLDDVVSAALAEFQAGVEGRRRAQAALKSEIKKGLDDIERGEVFDEETVFGELGQILGHKREPAA
jgi:Arc/MetJ-type ribon-helix-helix transcriptional regulator